MPQSNEEERQSLLQRAASDARPSYSSSSSRHARSMSHDNNSLLSRAGRSHSIGALGGTSSLGTFSIPDLQVAGLPKSYSVAANGSPGYFLTPTELGRLELYKEVPFQAVHGLQKHERSISETFAQYAASQSDLAAYKSMEDGHNNNNSISNGKESNNNNTDRRSFTSATIMDELEFDASVVTMPLVCAVLCASACQFIGGYNLGVMNAPAAVVFPSHTTLEWSLAVSAFCLGGPFGAVAGGILADSRGRRGALLLCTWTFLIGGLLQTLALNMVMMTISRFIIGFASGFSSVLVPIYLGELAPPTLRGMLGTLTQFAMVIGILVANLLAFPFANEKQWRLLFAVTPVLSVILLLLAPFLLESPRWLLGRDPKSIKARYIVKRLRGLRYDHEVETEVGHFVMGSSAQNQEMKSTTEVLKDMWKRPKIRTLLISALVLQVGQQFSGVNAVFYYSTAFFEGVIDNPLVGTTIVSAINVLATFAVLFLMDSCGRKTLLLWSSGGMFLSCLVIVFALLGYLGNIWSLFALCSYVSFFEFGLGPIPWLIVAEMFEGKYVATAMSLSCQVNWAGNFIIGFIFPYVTAYLGPYTFAPFAAILGGVFMFSWTALPETQGITPEQLLENMTRSLSQAVYEPNRDSANQLDEEWHKAMEQLQQEEDQERQ
ncbi:hypothetical protein MPSEU_000623700 [Mayamaea pseudoterrestris]|nr:hypothetical protein MPSEU_000623700 [Mayamaea pseudoterrestris]